MNTETKRPSLRGVPPRGPPSAPTSARQWFPTEGPQSPRPPPVFSYLRHAVTAVTKDRRGRHSDKPTDVFRSHESTIVPGSRRALSFSTRSDAGAWKPQARMRHAPTQNWPQEDAAARGQWQRARRGVIRRRMCSCQSGVLPDWLFIHMKKNEFHPKFNWFMSPKHRIL